MTDITLTELSDGGVASAQGFKAGGIHAGFRHDPNRLDMALVEADQLCPAAGVFTQNVFCAAPVALSKEHLDGCGYGLARAMLVNSGIANAATGPEGVAAARRMAQIAANQIGCVPEDILVASTGVIGVQLDTTPFEYGVASLQQAFDAPEHSAQAHPDHAADGALMEVSGLGAARGIMTTDTVPKQAAVSWTSQDPAFPGMEFVVGGMSKGSGMIMPDMATMIAVLTTDAPLVPQFLHQALKQAVDQSFNKVTVDSDTSTNDTCVAFASGAAAFDPENPEHSAGTFAPGSIAFEEFQAALTHVCQDLARQMARDGEGATKLVTVTVSGAANHEQADLAARTVANSPLVKTAIYGNDANWGRIAAALGRSGAQFAQEDVDIDIMGLPVMRSGLPVPFSEEEALERFKDPEIAIDVTIGAGLGSATIWTCDFTHDYVSINGDYRS